MKNLSWMWMVVAALVVGLSLYGCGETENAEHDHADHAGHDHDHDHADHDGHDHDHEHGDEHHDEVAPASHLGGGPAMIPVLAEGKGFDPVCGMTPDIANSAGTVKNNGLTFYFCNPKCKEKFEAAPENYTYCPVTKEKVDATLTKEVAGVTYYFCCKKCQSMYGE